MALAGVGDQKPQGVAGFRVRFLDVFVGRELRDRFFVSAAAAEQRARHREIGREGWRQVHLHPNFRHSGPGAEDMRDAMAAQACEVLGRKKLRITDLDRRNEKRAGSAARNGSSSAEKRAGVRITLPWETAEFENQHGYARMIRRKEIEKRRLKQRSVQERRIVIARARAVTGMRRGTA